MAASTSATLDDLAPWLAGLGDDLARINWRRPLKALSILLESYTKQNFERGTSPDGVPWEQLHHARPNSKGGDLPLRDRGILMASVTAHGEGHVENITDTSLEWGTALDYAGLHQEGGTVTPKNAGALSIPLTVEATRYRSPRDFPAGLFVWKSKTGHAFLAQSQEKGRGKNKHTQLNLHYLLLKSVTVPARPFVGLSEEFLKDADELLLDEVTRQLGTTPP